MGKRWPPSNEDGPHKWMFMVIAMKASRMIRLTLLLALYYIELALQYDRPSSFRYDPEGSDALVLRKMISFRHVHVAEVDLNVWVGLSFLDELLVYTVEILRPLRSKSVK